MALIQCKECGHMVSDRAKVCPKCGTPVNGDSYYDDCCEGEEPKKKKWWIWIAVVAAVCLLGGGGYYAYSKLGQKDDKTTSHASQQDEEVKEDIVEFTPEFIQAIGEYDELGLFSEGLAAVKKGDKWGYISAKGEEVIPANFEAIYAGRFSEGLAFVFTCENGDGYGDYISGDGWVIDKDGNKIFKVTNFFLDLCGPTATGVAYSSEDMPFFIDGKLYIGIMSDNDEYDIYTEDGKKTRKVLHKKKKNVVMNTGGPKYMVFKTNNKVEGTDGYKTCGLKDSSGKVVLPAIYDKINGVREGETCVSNGVVLVQLYRAGLYDDIEDMDSYSNPHHAEVYYGYADLKGNDTFSNRLKRECKESKIDFLQNYANQPVTTDLSENEVYNKPSWIKGNWKCYVDVFGAQKEYRVGISDEYITVFMAGEHYYTGPYSISGDMITYKDNYLLMDYNRQVIMVDKSTDMHRF